MNGLERKKGQNRNKNLCRSGTLNVKHQNSAGQLSADTPETEKLYYLLNTSDNNVIIIIIIDIFKISVVISHSFMVQLV